MRIVLIALVLSLLITPNGFSSNNQGYLNTDSIITDYDGNVYQTVKIGSQTWLKQNLKSIHYADGTSIPDVVGYNNSDSMAAIYGRLYTWNAAMRNSTQEKTQGVCPCGWHIPSDGEWTQLENYLGGISIAGGKMKDTGTVFWNPPNIGATNSSGFSALPGGEYDAYYSPNKFSLIKEYAVFWTSTNISSTKARERYLAYNKQSSDVYDWFKVMKYSIRCIKDSVTTSIKNNETKILTPNKVLLNQNYPNPFNPSTEISFKIFSTSFVSIKIFDVLGNELQTIINEEKQPGQYMVTFNSLDRMSSGIYLCRLQSGFECQYIKMVFKK
jgi:uncharacterized protein (TIGR02145 family)